jgi:hypothetical protein
MNNLKTNGKMNIIYCILRMLLFGDEFLSPSSFSFVCNCDSELRCFALVFPVPDFGIWGNCSMYPFFRYASKIE